jgi:hypothetical protein
MILRIRAVQVEQLADVCICALVRTDHGGQNEFETKRRVPVGRQVLSLEPPPQRLDLGVGEYALAPLFFPATLFEIGDRVVGHELTALRARLPRPFEHRMEDALGPVGTDRRGLGDHVQ